MPLFEIAITQKPTKKEAEDGKAEELRFGPKAVVAKDQQSAVIDLAMSGELPKDLDRTRMEIHCRPFA
jgi:hypothetical protein